MSCSSSKAFQKFCSNSEGKLRHINGVKIESPKSCRLRIIFTSDFVMVLANVIRRWFAQFCNSFDIKSQRQLKPNSGHPTGPYRRTVSVSPTAWLHSASIPAGALGGFTSLDWEPELVWCAPHLGLSQTHPLELTKPESPSAPTRTLWSAVPGIRPFNPKKLREPFTISLLHSLCLWKFCKTTHLNVLRERKSLMLQERKIHVIGKRQNLRCFSLSF